jgi:dihydroorotate dehydrogenase (fumarate)
MDAVKAILAGADCVQLVSALLRHGPSALTRVARGFQEWAERHDYTSVRQMRGRMGLSRCSNPEAFERGNYVKILQSWPRAAAPSVSH